MRSRIFALFVLFCASLQAVTCLAADQSGATAVKGQEIPATSQVTSITGVSVTLPQAYNNTPVVVLPETETPVDLSSSDINRLVCPVDIKDVIYSKEKGVIVKITGKNAFIKFLVKKEGDKENYSTTPTEMYVVCGAATYNLIAMPKRIPARTVILSNGDNKVKKNESLFKGMPFEKELLSIIKYVYKQEIPDSFSVTEEHQPFNLYKRDGLNLILIRSVRIDGEGLRAKEFAVRAIKNAELNEKDFLKNELATNPVAIAIDKLRLAPGDTARVIIIERVAVEGGNQ